VCLILRGILITTSEPTTSLIKLNILLNMLSSKSDAELAQYWSALRLLNESCKDTDRCLTGATEYHAETRIVLLASACNFGMRCDRSIRMVIQTELVGYESFYGTVALPEDQTDG
jgi:hypothetical protein